VQQELLQNIDLGALVADPAVQQQLLSGIDLASMVAAARAAFAQKLKTDEKARSTFHSALVGAFTCGMVVCALYAALTTACVLSVRRPQARTASHRCRV
jgi:hypothetical protein